VIIKGNSRGRARELARHLLRTDQNETVRLFECRGTAARDLEGALREMEAIGLASRTGKPLYHASISPEKDWTLTDAQVTVAADTLEQKLGLAGQPRLIVRHRKQGRDHVHVVWSRIDIALGRAVPDGWNYRQHERTARELEAAFGHPVLTNSREGRRAAPHHRTAKDYEYRQAERSGRTSRETASELSALWQGAADAQAFQVALCKAGYTLARGDRRVFVVIDRGGQVHSLGRRLGLRSRDLRMQLPGLDLAALPSVAEARPVRKRPRTVRALTNYRAAALEATQAQPPPTVRPRRVARQDRPKPDIRITTAQIAWINSAAHAAGRPARISARRYRARRTARRYRSDRAIILAMFAAKIADVLRHAAPNDREAMIEALLAERVAALRALAERSRGDTRDGRSATTRPKRSTQRRRYFRLRRMILRRRPIHNR
jgi:hypothetical protein